MSYPARGPIGTMGIDGKANAAGRRREDIRTSSYLAEAAA
jgi:hypothetical protein